MDVEVKDEDEKQVELFEEELSAPVPQPVEAWPTVVTLARLEQRSSGWAVVYQGERGDRPNEELEAMGRVTLPTAKRLRGPLGVVMLASKCLEISGARLEEVVRELRHQELLGHLPGAL